MVREELAMEFEPVGGVGWVEGWNGQERKRRTILDRCILDL
jgi:hypothetical protein